MAGVTFTLDLEDHREHTTDPVRYPAVVHRVLDDLARRGVRATVFVVGEVAEQSPDLVRSVARAGHELGLHGWRHDPLTTLTPAVLAADAARGKALLEDLGEAPVTGFRAPTFSLVAGTTWAADVLADAGFSYSSSVLPARNPLFGYPEAPDRPFRWPSGLVELPCPVVRVRGTGLPYLGGTYLRVLPWPAVAAALRSAPAAALLWTYCHPYDFDAGAPFWRVEPSWWQSRLLWLNRRRMFDKVGRVLARGAAPPLAERVAAGLDLPTWSPIAEAA